MRQLAAAVIVMGDRQFLFNGDVAGRRIDPHNKGDDILVGASRDVGSDIAVHLIGRHRHQDDLIIGVEIAGVDDGQIRGDVGGADRGTSATGVLENEGIERIGALAVRAIINSTEQAGRRGGLRAEPAGRGRFVARRIGIVDVGPDGFIERDGEGGLSRHMRNRTVILDAEDALAQIDGRLAGVAVGIGQGLHDLEQVGAGHSESLGIVVIAGIVMPDIFRLAEGDDAAAIDADTEIFGPADAADDVAAHLVEDDLGTLAKSRHRVHGEEAGAGIAAVQRQCITNAAIAIRSKIETGHLVEIVGKGRSDRGNTVTADAHGFVKGQGIGRGIGDDRLRPVILNAEHALAQIDAGLAGVTIGIRQCLHDLEEIGGGQGQSLRIIVIVGIVMPDIVGLAECHRAVAIDADAEILGPADTADDIVAGLVEENLGALAGRRHRVDRKKAGRDIAAGQVEGIGDAAGAIGAEIRAVVIEIVTEFRRSRGNAVAPIAARFVEGERIG